MAKIQCLTILSHYLTSLHKTLHSCVICFLKRDQQRKRCGIRHLLSTFWCSLAIEKVNGFYPLWRPLCFHSTECISSHNVESISIQPTRCISSHNINVIFIILTKCISFHLIWPYLSISSYTVIGISVHRTISMSSYTVIDISVHSTISISSQNVNCISMDPTL